MFKLGQVRQFVVAIAFGGTLFAQHYQGRDHTVFHRPAPAPAPAPVLNKHASATQATTALVHVPVAAPARNADAIDQARRRNLTVGAPPASGATHSSRAAQALPNAK